MFIQHLLKEREIKVLKKNNTLDSFTTRHSASPTATLISVQTATLQNLLTL